MVFTDDLVSYVDQLLQADLCKDYCPNGLQIAGKQSIKKISAAVTADQAVLEQAVAQETDLLLVHHGYFWKGEPANITGMKYQRIKTIITHELNLLAYHLPLDIHPTFGNNAQLGKVLGFELSGCFDALGTKKLGAFSELNQPITPEALAERLEERLVRKPLHIAAPDKPVIRKLAWVTGAAQDAIEQAALAGCDAFISGEVSERTYYQAKELNIHYFSAGHHATEKYGVRALGEHLADKYQLTYDFIDNPNPV